MSQQSLNKKNEANQKKISSIAIGEWVVMTENGLWYGCTLDDNKASYSTKKEAIQDVSGSTSDPRERPKVKRIDTGHYEYTPLDVDTYPKYRFGESYDIIKVTAKNIDEYKDILQTQWDDDPLSAHDEEE